MSVGVRGGGPGNGPAPGSQVSRSEAAVGAIPRNQRDDHSPKHPVGGHIPAVGEKIAKGNTSANTHKPVM